MFTKVYEKVLEYLKKEYKFFCFLLAIFLLFTIKLPYYIDIPGGTIDISKRIKVDDKSSLNGSLNFAYVSELRATIPTLIIDYFNSNWDLLKKEDVVMDNQSISDMEFRDTMLLKESMSYALYAGFSEAGEDFSVINNKIYVTYIFEEAKTDIKVKDEIIRIDDVDINDKDDLKIVNEKDVGDVLSITVINDGKEYQRKASIIEYEGKHIIGIGINETFDVDSSHDIDIKYGARESGPSGGFMTSLAVYSYLTSDDIIKGKNIVGTGTIDIDGNVGSIGGVKYKLMGAVKNKADLFLVPSGENYEEALKVKLDKGYDIEIIPVSTLKEAIEALKKL